MPSFQRNQRCFHIPVSSNSEVSLQFMGSSMHTFLSAKGRYLQSFPVILQLQSRLALLLNLFCHLSLICCSSSLLTFSASDYPSYELCFPSFFQPLQCLCWNLDSDSDSSIFSTFPFFLPFSFHLLKSFTCFTCFNS